MLCSNSHKRGKLIKRIWALSLLLFVTACEWVGSTSVAGTV